MKKTCLLLLLFAICAGTALGQDKGTDAAAFTSLKNLLTTPPPVVDKDGKLVVSSYPGSRIEKLEYVDACRKLFTQAMRRRGIDMRGGVHTSIRKRRPITTAEIFGGHELIDWLRKVVTKYDMREDGKGLIVKIEFGIYNQEFLDNNTPRPFKDLIDAASGDLKKKIQEQVATLQEKRLGRITAFLLVYRANSETKEVTNDDPIEGFDLGEIYPPKEG